MDEPLLLAVNASKGTVVARSVRWAGTSEARRRGLLGRDSLGAQEGMYLVPTQCIHMFGMRFPIDVAFLASDGRVIHTYHGIKPNRLSRVVWRSEGALELAEGTLLASNTTVGDIVEFHEDPGRARHQGTTGLNSHLSSNTQGSNLSPYEL
jgi:uncharacterized membrane protein (UPF0127 family)